MDRLLDDWKLACCNIGMSKPNLPNFSLPKRIVFGIIAIFLVGWMLRISGVL